ncbi:MAG: hypothetical protein ACT4QC_14780 [Planctomycetaceae bacterium]
MLFDAEFDRHRVHRQERIAQETHQAADRWADATPLADAIVFLHLTLVAIAEHTMAYRTPPDCRELRAAGRGKKNDPIRRQ